MKLLNMVMMVLLGGVLFASGCTQTILPKVENKPFVPIVNVVEETGTKALVSTAAVQAATESQWVILEHSSFLPADVEVHVGDTVEWVNADDETYTFNLEGITGARLPIGGRTEYQFNKAGVYSYSARLIETHADDDTENRILRGVVLVE